MTYSNTGTTTNISLVYSYKTYIVSNITPGYLYYPYRKPLSEGRLI